MFTENRVGGPHPTAQQLGGVGGLAPWALRGERWVAEAGGWGGPRTTWCGSRPVSPTHMDASTTAAVSGKMFFATKLSKAF